MFKNTLIAIFSKHLFIIKSIQAIEIINRLTSSLQVRPFDFIRRTDPAQLLNFIQGEHPQTIALIVAHMDAQKQIAMIKHFPDSMRPEIILRMASLDYVSPDKVEEMDEVLKKELLSKRKDYAVRKYFGYKR